MRAEWISELWEYWELFYFLAWRDIKVRYKQTVPGVAWVVLQPILTMILFVVLLGRFAQLPSDGLPYPLFYYAALIPWMYFATALGMCGTSLVNNVNLITKVYFPRSVLPASVVLSGLLDLGISALLIVGLLAYYRMTPGWSILLVPVLLLLLVALTYGQGLLFAAITVKYRDVKYAIPFAIQLGLFVTPVIYPISILPEPYRFWAGINPLCGIIDSFRAVLISGHAVQWDLLGLSATMTAAIVAVVVFYFRRAESSFADLI